MPAESKDDSGEGKAEDKPSVRFGTAPEVRDAAPLSVEDLVYDDTDDDDDDDDSTDEEQKDEARRAPPPRELTRPALTRRRSSPLLFSQPAPAFDARRPSFRRPGIQ